jgi:glycosyltransferase involved in cell wall biosynthesis
MSRNKILYLTYDGLTDALGQSQIVAYLKRLAGMGNEISIISFEKDYAYQKTGVEIKNIIAQCNIQWYPLPYTKNPPVFSTIQDVYRGWQAAKKIYSTCPFDIVHCRGYITAIIGQKLQKEYGVKFIFDMRGWWADEKLESGDWNSKLFSPVYQYFKNREKVFFKKADFIVSLTIKGAEEIQRQGWAAKQKIGVIPTCVDFDIFKERTAKKRIEIRKSLSIDPNAKVLIYSGSIGGNYDVQRIIDVFKSFAAIHNNPFLLILAKDGVNDAIKKIFTDANIHNLSITQVPFIQVTDYLASADAGLVFYKDSFSIIGRSPTKLGEYWASGLPIISFQNIGDIDNIFVKYPGGGVLLSEDKKSWKEQMNSLVFDNPDRLRQYAKDYFDIEKGVHFYNNVYNKLRSEPRILYITYDGLTDPLGQSQILPYLKGLSDYGYHFTILSFEKKNRLIEERELIKSLTSESGIDWIPMSFTSNPPLISKLYDAVRMRNKAVALHKQKAFDMVHCRSYIAADVGLYLKKKFGVKFLFDMRGFWADEKKDGSWNVSNPFFSQVYKYYKRKEAQYLQHSNYIISLSNAGKKEMLTWPAYNKNIPVQVIPCCADMNLFSLTDDRQKIKSREKLGIEKDRFVLSYLGSVGTWYMLDEMLNFFLNIKKQFPHSLFLFVTHSDHSFIDEKIKLHGLKPLDFIIMQAARKEVPWVIKASDLNISFIKPVYSKISSSPTKMGEVLSMGIPVICNRGVGDVEEIVKKAGVGFVFNTFTAADHTEALAAIPYLLQKQPAEIRNAIKDIYSLANGIELYKECYKQVLA